MPGTTTAVRAGAEVVTRASYRDAERKRGITLDGFATTVGAVASAIAIASALYGTVVWWRQRRVLGELGSLAQRLLRVDRRLVALAVDVDALLAKGVGWHGVEIEPPMLRGHRDYMWAQIDELERARARVRALAARGATERIRETVEEAIETLRRACVVYFDGTMTAYQEAQGVPMPPGATGRDPTAVLHESPDAGDLPELRKSMELAVRTVAHQLERPGVAEGYRCRWPLTRAEVAALAKTDLWGGEPRPIMHATDPTESGFCDG